MNDVSAEVVLKLDKFKPRDYQIPLINAIEKEGFKKALCLWCRRCLHPDTHIIMANGSFKLLKDIKEGDEILSWNGSVFEADRVKHIWKTEEKETIKLQAKAGPPIIASPDHVFAVSWQDRHIDWIKAQDIKGTRQFQLYPGMPCNGTHHPDMAEFLGYLCADGYVSRYQQPKFTNTNIDILKRVEYLTFKLFGYKVIWREKGNGYDLGLTNGTRGGGYTPNAIKMLFRDYNMNVPKNIRPLHPLINTYDEQSIGRFLAALISCYGSIFIHKGRDIYDKQRDRRSHIDSHIDITLSCGKSFAYGWGIYWLLRKLGIIPHQPIIEHSSNFKIRIGHYEQIKKLLSYGPIYGKEDKQSACLEPIADHNQDQQNIYDGCYRSGFKSSIPDETTELYDLETEKNHNFVANGYLVHNSGKDLTAWNIMIRAAIRKPGIYFYCLPTFKQARLTIWDNMTIDSVKLLDYLPYELIARKNEQEMKITLINGSLIQLIGSDSYDNALIGTNPSCIIFSEYALADPKVYEFIRPIMNANGGLTIFLSTPRRKENHLYNLYQIATNSPDWWVSKLTVEDCHHISVASIMREVDTGECSLPKARQEYWCEFISGNEGEFYVKYMDKLRFNNQIGSVPWEPNFAVNTAWDIGIRDSTSIIFYQQIGNVIHIIDSYQNSKEGLEHYINIINSKPYTYGKHIGPHDLAVREWTSGETRISKARQLGLRFTIADNIQIMDGIEAVRSMLPRCYIDEKNCKTLIRAFDNYRQEYDEKRQVYYDKPLHDMHSHFCDAARYMAISLGKTRQGLTADDLDKRYEDAMLQGSNRVPRPFKTEYW